MFLGLRAKSYCSGEDQLEAGNSPSSWPSEKQNKQTKKPSVTPEISVAFKDLRCLGGDPLNFIQLNSLAPAKEEKKNSRR